MQLQYCCNNNNDNITIIFYISTTAIVIKRQWVVMLHCNIFGIIQIMLSSVMSFDKNSCFTFIFAERKLQESCTILQESEEISRV